MPAIPRRFFRIYLLLVAGWWLVPVISPGLVHGQHAAYAPLRGRWQAIELVDDGRVIPQDAIHTWIPSGGQLEVIDNESDLIFLDGRGQVVKGVKVR